MSKERREQLVGLRDCIQIEASIECTKCYKGTLVDDMFGEEDAYKQGWRTTKNNCYCPLCAKKYLKSKNKQ